MPMLIDTEKLNTLSLKELALLLFLYDKNLNKTKVVSEIRDIDIEKVFESLADKGYIVSSIYATDFSYNPPLRHISHSLVQKGKEAIADNCVQEHKMTKKQLNQKELRERCDALAIKLMELYPMGRKPGTNNQWRGYKAGVSEKLQKLIMNGNEFTDEEAIQATKNYIGGFNGQYTTMRVLPYFLSKQEIIAGEVKRTSDFLSYVEDLRSNPNQKNLSNDWESELK